MILEADGESTKVTATSGFSGKTSDITYPYSIEELTKRLSRVSMGEYIQRVFPELDAGKREFLMTGVSPAEWDALFGTGDEDDDETSSEDKTEGKL